MLPLRMPQRRSVHVIRIHCPVTPPTLAALASGQLSAIETDPVVARILDLIRADNVLGDFGLYRGVFEVSLGLEGFTPTVEAAPTLGDAGANALSPTVIIKTYVASDIADEQLSALLAALAERHPWQIPVIELQSAILVF